MKTYKVEFTKVSLPGRDVHKGDRITEENLEGVDVKRLVELGAIKLVSETVEHVESTENTLASMSFAELKEMAKELGVDVTGLKSRAALTEAIEARNAELQAADQGEELPEGSDKLTALSAQVEE